MFSRTTGVHVLLYLIYAPCKGQTEPTTSDPTPTLLPLNWGSEGIDTEVGDNILFEIMSLTTPYSPDSIAVCDISIQKPPFAYYCFRKGIAFSQTLLWLETAQMHLCHSCTLCAQTGQRAFGDLQQTSADDQRPRTAESDSNFHANEPNALCPVCAHNVHE